MQDYLKDKQTVGHLAGKRPKYDGVWQSLRKIGREEGLRGYFKGNGANCVRVFPYTAIQFAAYVAHTVIRVRHGTLPPWY